MSFYPSRTKQQRIKEQNVADPIFKPKIPVGTEIIYFQKYTDDWGHKLERRITTQILDENPRDKPYQLQVKILIENKARWVSRSSVIPLKKE
ncbi:hypothetical protein I8752_25040 [Nostocaceae cyanobacterium CENA369]|uniref:Uncharacterized protein n=1 Tax=Dendronalium phyllosphericum CENA369 TaxID=1725256 RepID=A0A8J7LHQ3_9NOST|nr:hypothetical protein [Dendronalium phyllosphericum]MBH8576199.1 hypothetical protein [Dendronalium phyllosphericum CENA369]